MTVAHVDIESFSECDLRDCGLYKYAEHPSTEVTVLGYAFDDGPVTLWVPRENLPLEMVVELRRSLTNGDKLYVNLDVPADLREHIEAGGKVHAHNASFERVVLNGTAGKRLNFPHIAIESVVCTAAKCAANGLPRALGDAAKALGTHDKSDAGRIEMLQISKPRKPTKANPDTRWTPENAPEKFIAMYRYNLDDVRAERDIDHAVPDLPSGEVKTYRLDAKQNDRGWEADTESTANILAVVDEYKAFLAAECEKATRDPLLDTEGLKPTQREKIAEWVRANGYPQLLDMQAETVKAIILDPNVPAPVKHVLKIYSTFNAKAISKFGTILDMACADGRLHGMFLYHGANTGRWSSGGVQLQNLSRGHIDDPGTAIEAFRARSLAWIRALYPDVDPIKVAASCVRGMLVAGEGKDLLFPDYAGIESRVGAWLFDEEWKLEAFRKYDTILRDEQTGEILRDEKGEPLRAGPDNYKLAYARAFGVKPEDVKKAQRQIGKVMELFLQYEGGAGAFVTGAETYGFDLQELADTVLPTLPEDVKAEAQRMWDEMPQHRAGLPWSVFIAVDSLKRLWRRAHPKIRQGWKDLKAAAEQAVQFPGKAYAIPNGKLAFKVVEYKGRSWLYMRLPSGRRLAYYNPRWIPEQVVKRRDEFGNEYEEVIPGEMRYWGTDTYTRRWMEVSTYGGKLFENGDQGMSACILRCGLFALEENDYPVIGSVHDEPVTEPKKGHGSVEHARSLMCRPIPWAPGLPLAAEGHRSYRYKK